MKIKTLVQKHILRHFSHVVQVLGKAKSMIMELIKSNRKELDFFNVIKRQKQQKKLFCTSMRMYYTWPSSHVLPMPEDKSIEEYDGESRVYYDATWDSIISMEEGEVEPQLSGYLQWLDEKVVEECDEAYEIDRLAEKFIAKCHEKFRLEKEESYRLYQEMLARSM